MGCARSQYDLESEARGVAVNKMRVPNVQCGMVSHTNDGQHTTENSTSEQTTDRKYRVIARLVFIIFPVEKLIFIK